MRCLNKPRRQGRSLLALLPVRCVGRFEAQVMYVIANLDVQTPQQQAERQKNKIAMEKKATLDAIAKVEDTTGTLTIVSTSTSVKSRFYSLFDSLNSSW